MLKLPTLIFCVRDLGGNVPHQLGYPIYHRKIFVLLQASHLELEQVHDMSETLLLRDHLEMVHDGDIDCRCS